MSWTGGSFAAEVRFLCFVSFRFVCVCVRVRHGTRDVRAEIG